MKISFYVDGRQKNYEFSKVNIVYGYSKSGKTFFANELNYGFTGQDRQFQLNGTYVPKGLNKVIFIDCKQTIMDHIKLNSKSFLKTYIDNLLANNSFTVDTDSETEKIFGKINTFLESVALELNKRADKNKFCFALKKVDSEALIDQFTTVCFKDEYLSSSDEKELLFSLVDSLGSEDNRFVIIDDFDKDLDEESTIKFLKRIEKSNDTFFLFSNKPSSIHYCLGRYSIFAVRETNVYDLTNIYMLIKDSQKGLKDHFSYEEYMMNYGYALNSGMIDEIYKKVTNSALLNIGRILTSKDPIIEDNFSKDHISIVASSSEEKTFYGYLFDILSINQQ